VGQWAGGDDGGGGVHEPRGVGEKFFGLESARSAWSTHLLA
jgi:hypothetical protein